MAKDRWFGVGCSERGGRRGKLDLETEEKAGSISFD
jgi:hypothetical protein